MTIELIKTILEGVTGFTDKVAYLAFPENQAPMLPFICFYSPSETHFSADGIVYHAVPDIIVELYAKDRDFTSESLIESAFTANGLYYEKESTYLEDEKCYETIYSL